MIHIEKAHGGEGGKNGKNEMNVEGEGDREGSDVSSARGGGSRDEVFHEFYWADTRSGSQKVVLRHTINWTKKVLLIRYEGGGDLGDFGPSFDGVG